jgi:hypothetical protein
MANIKPFVEILVAIGAVAGAVGSVFFGIKYLWPPIIKLAVRGANAFSLWRMRSLKLDKLSRAKQLDILEAYQNIVSRSQAYGLDRQNDEALQMEKAIRYELRYRVCFFPIATSLKKVLKECCISFILAQNRVQPLFQFELGHLEQPMPVEDGLGQLPPDLPQGHFIEKCEDVMARVIEMPTKFEDPITIVVTQASLPKQNFLWGHFEGDWHKPPRKEWGRFPPNRFWVISLAKVDQVIPDIPVEYFILRMIQRACINSILPVRPKNSDKSCRLSHKRTYSCLFDYTVFLHEARYFVQSDYICDDCASEILQADTLEIPFGHRGDFLTTLQKWLTDTRYDRPGPAVCPPGFLPASESG